MCPRQVGSKFDGAVVVVAIGCTDTHSLDFFNTAYLFNDRLQCFNRSFDIVFNFGVTTSFDSGSSFDFTTSINDAEY